MARRLIDGESREEDNGWLVPSQSFWDLPTLMRMLSWTLAAASRILLPVGLGGGVHRTTTPAGPLAPESPYLM